MCWLPALGTPCALTWPKMWREAHGCQGIGVPKGKPHVFSPGAESRVGNTKTSFGHSATYGELCSHFLSLGS